MTAILGSGLALAFLGLCVAGLGAYMAGTAMTTRRPADAPQPQGGGTNLYLDLDRARRGLWTICAGTVMQIVGVVQACVLLLN